MSWVTSWARLPNVSRRSGSLVALSSQNRAATAPLWWYSTTSWAGRPATQPGPPTAIR